MTRPTEQPASPWATACEGPYLAKPMLDCALMNGEIVASRVFDNREDAERDARILNLLAAIDTNPFRHRAVPLPIVSR